MKEFFDLVRGPVFGGTLTQSQVDGMNDTLESFAKYGEGGLSFLAYILATEAWETGYQMQPVKETQFAGQPQPTDAQVKARLTKAWKAGKLKWVKKPYWGDGWFGRGKVQLTHEFNYKGVARNAVLKEFSVDIAAKPDLVLRPDISCFILIRGVIEGWFTGKKLADYIDDKDESDAEDYKEYMGARRSVNGQDRAKEIATLALKFESALRQAFDKPPTVQEDTRPAPGTVIPKEKAHPDDSPPVRKPLPGWAVPVGIGAVIVAGLALAIFL